MEILKKIPWGGHYPSAARFLMEEDITSIPRQEEVVLKWAAGVNIVYTLRNLTPANFQKYSDTLLLLAEQEATRYNKFRWKFASFEVRLGRMKKGKDLAEVQTYKAAMHDDPDIMVYGPGYEVPQKFFLKDKVEEILDIAKRYPGKVSRQHPYKVEKLIIFIREPWEWPLGVAKNE